MSRLKAGLLHVADLMRVCPDLRADELDPCLPAGFELFNIARDQTRWVLFKAGSPVDHAAGDSASAALAALATRR
ncbi:MAG TPA: hypothetical protein PKE29_16505 [Phycisphaerales bacterium]|nr:hypothetical protein [Phycisphaerales bacterium]